MLASETTFKDGSFVLPFDLPIIQQKALEKAGKLQSNQPIPYAEYRSWYLDKFYPNKALQASILLEWLPELVLKHSALEHFPGRQSAGRHPAGRHSAEHRKAIVTYVESKGADHYYLRAKVYAMPTSEGCKVELEVKGEHITRFELLSYFPFERHHEKNATYNWKSFMVLGKRDGVFTMYYPNGSMMQQGYFNSGRRVGLWTNYDPDGKVSSSQIYEFAHTI